MANGVSEIDIVNNLKSYADGIGAVTALFGGKGSTSAPVTDAAVADRNFVGLWTKTTAASGDNRAMYWRHYFAGATGGEVARLFATISSTTSTTGTVNGVHASATIASGGTVSSGAMNAIRATIGAAAGATIGGTSAAIQVDSDIDNSLTTPATWSFIRVTDSGAKRIANLFSLPNAANGTLLAAHTTQTMSHSIKCVSADGTAYYIMCTATATNRS